MSIIKYQNALIVILAAGVLTAMFNIVRATEEPAEIDVEETIIESSCETADEVTECSDESVEESFVSAETSIIEETEYSEPFESEQSESEQSESDSSEPEPSVSGFNEFEAYVDSIPSESWKITVYTTDDLSYINATSYGYSEGIYVFEADTPMVRDNVISCLTQYSYEITESSAPWSYIDRMTVSEAADFYRDFFEIRGISIEQMSYMAPEVLDGIMAEWDYAGTRASLDANDLV